MQLVSLIHHFESNFYFSFLEQMIREQKIFIDNNAIPDEIICSMEIDHIAFSTMIGKLNIKIVLTIKTPNINFFIFFYQKIADVFSNPYCC